MAPPPIPLLPASASVSLGKPGGHSLPRILKAAAKAGLKGIEICYNNLRYHTASLSSVGFGAVTHEQLLEAAVDTRRLCNELDLKIMVLQPFALYDGLTDPEMHRKMIEKFKGWLELAQAMDCDIIQIPSNFSRTGTTGDMDRIVADMVEIADFASKTDPPTRLAYEAVAWGAHIDLWEQSWEVVRRVDRPNFGLCLDTYHIAARVWADPEVASGKNENADVDLSTSLEQMVKTVDVSKIFYLQLSDAERLSSPLVQGHGYFVLDQPARMSWSRNARVFPCEEDYGGYMPILPIAKTVVNDLGYRGWISMEIFSRHLLVEDETVPSRFAERATRSYEKVKELLGWDRLLETSS